VLQSPCTIAAVSSASVIDHRHRFINTRPFLLRRDPEIDPLLLLVAASKPNGPSPAPRPPICPSCRRSSQTHRSSHHRRHVAPPSITTDRAAVDPTPSRCPCTQASDADEPPPAEEKKKRR
jgi:hypothetical protein